MVRIATAIAANTITPVTIEKLDPSSRPPKAIVHDAITGYIGLKRASDSAPSPEILEYSQITGDRYIHSRSMWGNNRLVSRR